MDSVGFDPDKIDFPSGCLIGGERVHGDGTSFEVFRPSDGKLVKAEKSASAALVDRAVTTAKEAFHNSGWATGEPRARQRVMRKWADLIDENYVELARLSRCGPSLPFSFGTCTSLRN